MLKKSSIKILIALQLLILSGVIATIYFTFMNKARIRATQQVLVDTQHQLGPTFEFMHQMAQRREALKPLAIGGKAPYFELTNENNKRITSTSLQGKKTLLVFSKENCPYCKKYYPVLNAFEKEQNDIKVIIVQVGIEPNKIKKYKTKMGIQTSILAGTQSEMISYKVRGTPSSILLDEQGKVLGSKTDTPDLNSLLSFVTQSIQVQKEEENCETCK